MARFFSAVIFFATASKWAIGMNNYIFFSTKKVYNKDRETIEVFL